MLFTQFHPKQYIKLQHIQFVTGQHFLFLQINELIDGEAVRSELRDPTPQSADNYLLRHDILPKPSILQITVYLVKEAWSESLLTFGTQCPDSVASQHDG